MATTGVKRGTFQLMKSINKSIVLNEIRTGAPISRAQIAKNTKLAPPTVGGIVRELMDENLVVETKNGESMGGRKPIMLSINNKAFSIVGVDVGPEKIVAIVSNLSGKILKRNDTKLEVPLGREEFTKSLKKCIHDLIQDLPEEGGELLGIGVAMHGVVDVARGVSLFAPNLGLKNVPIKGELEEEFGLPVMVENDVRAMALGESWFGGHGKLGSMFIVNVGHGVGGGMIIDGKLYYGERDIAGEIGHMTIDMNGKYCECGNRGCLQSFASGPAIAHRAEERTTPPFKLTSESVFALAKAGNQTYIDILEETGEYIGVGLTNLIHLVNPSKIVLAGYVMNGEEYILPKIRETIRARALTQEAKETEIVITKLGSDVTLLGAVSLFLVYLFE